MGQEQHTEQFYVKVNIIITGTSSSGPDVERGDTAEDPCVLGNRGNLFKESDLYMLISY